MTKIVHKGSRTDLKISGECFAKNFSIGAMTAQLRMIGMIVEE